MAEGRLTGSLSPSYSLAIFDSIIVAHGDNTYQITHMHKDKLERQGALRQELAVSQDDINTIINFNNLQPVDLQPVPLVDAPIDAELAAAQTDY
jgi:hypothetical protein